MRIALTVGHSRLKNKCYTSADGRHLGGVNEYMYNKKLVTYLAKELRKKGHTVDVIVCPEKKFLTSKEEKIYKLPRINGGNYNLCIELHLNAAMPSANGCEVLYVSETGKKYAVKVENQLSRMFKSRGIKRRTDLYMLNGTKPPCIMLETFFCTNKEDCKKAKNYKKVAELIAAAI